MSEARLFTRPLVLCALANLAQGLAFNLFLHFPGFLQRLGAGEVQIGLLFGLTSIAAILVRPPVGRAMDTRGRRAVILCGGALNTLVCSLYLTIHALGPWVYAVRIAHGLAEAMLFTALFTYAADWVPAARRTQGLALFGVSGMLPIGLGGMLGDAILARADYAALFTSAGLLAGLSLLISLPLADRERGTPSEAPPAGFAAALRQVDLLPLWWIGTVFATALAGVFAFLKLYVMETGLASVGGFFSAYSAAAIVLRIGFGWLPDRAGAKRVLLPALAALATGFLLLAVAQQARDVLAAGVLCGIGHGFAFPILFGMVVTRAREADRGSAMAVYTALFDAGVVIGGPVFGVLIGVGGFAAMFAAAAVAMVAGAAIFVVWDRGR